MKALLLYRDRDLDMERELPKRAGDLEQDLGLSQILQAAGEGDNRIRNVYERVLLFSLTEAEAIRYRQEILHDCIENEEVVRSLYRFTIETMDEAGTVHFGYFTRSPSSVLHNSVEVLRILVRRLREIRRTAEAQQANFRSKGFQNLFSTLIAELRDDYIAEMSADLKRLAFKDGVMQSARLGRGNAGIGYVLRRPKDDPRNWFQRIFTKAPPSASFRIADRDEAGARALSELRARGLNLVANAAAHSKDHILSFFENLQAELAFYVGCLNVRQHLAGLGLPTVMPEVYQAERRRHSCDGLYDASLALTLGRPVVGNSLSGDGYTLTIITGANQGGKSTFLRSVGAAQLLLQCGMLVPAERFEASVCSGVFTHFRREEDNEMQSGKLDEELRRMSDIVDAITPYSMVLFNESFAATNEREGSEIAGHITSALVEKDVKVLFVTHMYEYARRVLEREHPGVMFLQPEREEDGTRTFRVVEGKPTSTSYGPDLYRQVFESDTGTVPVQEVALDAID